MRRRPKPLPWRNLSLTKSSAEGSSCRCGTSVVAGRLTLEVASVRIGESRGDAQLLLDVGHHRVRHVRLAEFREVLSDDALP
jgi:hypothetical protein